MNLKYQKQIIGSKDNNHIKRKWLKILVKEFWGFVSKEDKYQLSCNYSNLKKMERVEGKDEVTLFSFIQSNKNKLGVDPAKVREKKLNRLICINRTCMDNKSFE